MSSGNEIVFFGDRDYLSQNVQSVIVYNDMYKIYKVLRDDQNYKSIDVIPRRHCVFKCKNISKNSGAREEKDKEKETENYISFDDKHFSIYKYNGKNLHQMKKYRIINKMNKNLGILSKAMCCSLFNRNGMSLCHFLYSM